MKSLLPVAIIAAFAFASPAQAACSDVREQMIRGAAIVEIAETKDEFVEAIPVFDEASRQCWDGGLNLAMVYDKAGFPGYAVDQIALMLPNAGSTKQQLTDRRAQYQAKLDVFQSRVVGTWSMYRGPYTVRNADGGQSSQPAQLFGQFNILKPGGSTRGRRYPFEYSRCVKRDLKIPYPNLEFKYTTAAGVNVAKSSGVYDSGYDRKWDFAPTGVLQYDGTTLKGAFSFKLGNEQVTQVFEARRNDQGNFVGEFKYFKNDGMAYPQSSMTLECPLTNLYAWGKFELRK